MSSTVIMNHKLPYWSFSVLVILMFAVMTVHAAPVAMVADVTGSVSVADRRLEVFDELMPGDTIAISAGGTVSILFYQDGIRFDVRGPSRIVIRPKTVRVVEGMPPRRIRTPYRERYRIHPAGLAQAASHMMAGMDTLPIPVHVTTMPVIHFPRTVSGRFLLMDGRHHIVITVDIQNTNKVDLAQLHIGLRRSRYYYWQVRNGIKILADGHLRIADNSLAEAMRRLRPSIQSATADHILYASWLRSRGLYTDARAYWRKIVGMRPDLRDLKSFYE